MNDIEQILQFVLTALACPLVLPVLMDWKEDDHEVSE